ncbi:hypothetical protein ACSSS7_004468 [Eimeria intestinalis]
MSRDVIIHITGRRQPQDAAAAAAAREGGRPVPTPRAARPGGEEEIPVGAPAEAVGEGAAPVPAPRAARAEAAGEEGEEGVRPTGRLGGRRATAEMGVQTEEEGEGLRPEERGQKETPWGRYSKRLVKRHGPYSRPPTWVSVSETCPVSPSPLFKERRLDLTKSSEDFVHRLSLLYPTLLSEIGGPTSPAFAALCSSTGVLLNAWQQHLEAVGVETAAASVAHISFIQKATNLHAFLLVSEREADPEIKGGGKAHEQRRKELEAFSTSKIVKTCMQLGFKLLHKLPKFFFVVLWFVSVRAGGSIAIAAYETQGGSKLKARSLYGGIANTLGVPLLLPAVIQTAFGEFLHEKLDILQQQQQQQQQGKKQQKGQQKKVGRKARQQVMGLCAALHVSSFLKECSKKRDNELLESLFDSTVDGNALAFHLLKAGRQQLAAVPGLLELCDPYQAQALYGDVLGKLLSAVSPQWEEEKMIDLFTRWKKSDFIKTSGKKPKQQQQQQAVAAAAAAAPAPAPAAAAAAEADEGEEETDEDLPPMEDIVSTDADAEEAADTEGDSTEEETDCSSSSSSNSSSCSSSNSSNALNKAQAGDGCFGLSSSTSSRPLLMTAAAAAAAAAAKRTDDISTSSSSSSSRPTISLSPSRFSIFPYNYLRSCSLYLPMYLPIQSS